MSVNIKDAEEKMLIIGYLRNRCKKDRSTFTNKSVYGTWLNHWADDFKISEHGKCPIMFQEQLVISKSEHMQGNEPPEHYKEYTNFIESVTAMLNRKFDARKNAWINARPYARLITQYRDNRTKDIKQLLHNTGLAEHGYGVKINNDSVFAELTKCQLYRVKNNIEESIMIDTFDTIEDYINNMLEDNHDL